MNNDDSYLMKLMLAGMPPSIIASKLNMTEEKVLQRFIELQKEREAAVTNGLEGLIAQFNVLCHQYQLVGESLKLLALGLSGTVTLDDVKKQVVPGDADTTAQNILSSFILLRPFEPMNPEEMLQQSILNS